MRISTRVIRIDLIPHVDGYMHKGHICPVPRSYVVAWLVDIIPHVDAYKYKGHTRVIRIDLMPHVDVYK